MKNHFFSILSAGMMMAAAYADYTASFEDPPFKIGETILGINGWQPRLANASPDDAAETARLVKVRWDGYKPAAVLSGASIKTEFPKTEGARVQVTVRLAITYADKASPLQQFRLLSDAPYGELVFSANENGGLGLGNGTGRDMKVLVPFKDLKPNSYYTFKATINYDQMTYDIVITGEKADGTPLNFEEKNVAFESTKTGINGVAIINSRDVRVYLQQLSVESL